MMEHLSGVEMNSLADGELSVEQMARVNAHLAGCAVCTRSALEQMMLKRGTARAGQRYSLPDDVRERVLRASRDSLRSESATASTSVRGGWRYGWVGWAAAAAVLVAMVSVGWVQRRGATGVEDAALVTEVCDQHVATMAGNAAPEVVSSDRHTVKPWFQGKLPFSFNLPTPLPDDTTLDGANLVYLRHRPVAQLMYSIGKHRVSVFVREKDGSNMQKAMSVEQAGFHVKTVSAGELEIVAVSDVEPSRLQELVSAIGAAQGK
jgi:anti-sigma factor RsiW